MVTFAHPQVGEGNEVACEQVWAMIVVHILIVEGDFGTGGKGL